MLLAQDERLTRRVGAIALVVIALAIAFFAVIHDSIEWGSKIRIEVYFHETGGLREGAPFVVAGRSVGRIESISLVPRGATTPLDGDAGIRVRVAIDASARIPFGGDVFVTSRGMFSDRYLEIGPAPALARPLRDGDEVLGRDPPSLDRVLERTWNNLTVTAQFMAEIRPHASALRVQLDCLRVTLDEIILGSTLGADVGALKVEAIRTYAALGGSAGIARMGAVVEDAGATVAQVRETMAGLRASADRLMLGAAMVRARLGDGGAIAKLELAIERVRAVTAKLDPLLAHIEALETRISRGEGSLLKLLHDPEFPEDMKELGKALKRQPWKIIQRPPD